jgi:hypothetical protein
MTPSQLNGVRPLYGCTYALFGQIPSGLVETHVRTLTPDEQRAHAVGFVLQEIHDQLQTGGWRQSGDATLNAGRLVRVEKDVVIKVGGTPAAGRTPDHPGRLVLLVNPATGLPVQEEEYDLSTTPASLTARQSLELRLISADQAPAGLFDPPLSTAR